jgi:hypothetical protein
MPVGQQNIILYCQARARTVSIRFPNAALQSSAEGATIRLDFHPLWVPVVHG